MSDLEGIMLSDYLLLQCISKGGVADVYRARQNGEGNYEVAVKVYRPGYAQRESFREHFMTEAEKIGQFDHPNILPFLEFGEGEGLLYVVTPFVATGTLEDLLRRVGGKFSALQSLPIVQQVCSAVQYAHDHDVIHGNIKPANIYIAADGRMLLADFGIAARYDDSQQSLTRVGWGSAEYTAPEQSLGVLRKSSDVYASGVLLFRILTGQVPFTGHTPVEVLLKHVRQPVPSARTFVPTISEAVDAVLRMAMQKRADDRFVSAEEFSNAFLAAVTVAPVASPVAKPVVNVSPPTYEHSVSANNPLTPVPALQGSSTIPDPHTPLPVFLAFNTSSASTFSAGEQLAEENTLFNPHDSAATEEPMEKNSIGEDQNFNRNSRFWSVDPVEWSPLSDGSTNVKPLTATAYLQDKPVIAPVSSPVVPDPEQAESLAAEGEQGTHKTSSAFTRKILPIVVVILLLLGLLGALLSSFYFPQDGPGANVAPLQHAQQHVKLL